MKKQSNTYKAQILFGLAIVGLCALISLLKWLFQALMSKLGYILIVSIGLNFIQMSVQLPYSKTGASGTQKTPFEKAETRANTQL